jgi:hypothetical protein
MSSKPIVPKAVVINHPLLFGVGTVGWFVAFALMVTLDLTGVYTARVWIAVCAVGVLLGLAATLYTKFSWRARPQRDTAAEKSP